MSSFSYDPEAWRRVSPYLDQVLDLAPSEREVWLTELGDTQPDIARAVRDFLVEQDVLKAQGFLDDPPFELIDAARAASSMVGKRLFGRARTSHRRWRR